jgi:hypothetical protein
MQKIPTLFKRDPEDLRHVLPVVTPGCEWVLAGEGRATRKFDGTCVLLDEELQWWNRREIRAGKEMPADAIDLGVDPNTGKHMVWVPNSPSGFKKQLEEAVAYYEGVLSPGTYELCGPKIDTRGGSNPERLTRHKLVRHKEAESTIIGPHPSYSGPLDFEMLRQAIKNLGSIGWEGVVWHHPDGRMAKLKVRDFA